MYKLCFFLLFFLIIIFSASTQKETCREYVQEPLLQSETYENWWENNTLKAVGYGMPRENISNAGIAKAIARRAAIMDAYANLAKQAGAVRITKEKTLLRHEVDVLLKGAEIILVPNDCGSMRPRVQALSTRAYENMCGIAMANPNGKNAGNSCAFSPVCWDSNGECVDNTLLLVGAETEGLFYADFDMDAIRIYRECEMLGNTFRKVKAYAELLNEDIQYPFIRE